MTNTTHLNLHTWALTDPVSVAEMNENFAALDEANARSDATASLHESALIRTAHRSMKNALLAYRADDAAYDDTGVYLADFSKGASQAAEVSNLRLVEGCYVLPHAEQQSVTLTLTDDHLDGGETRDLAAVTFEGFGTLESISADISGSEHSGIYYYLYAGEEKLAETACLDVADGGGTFAFSNAVEVYPGMTLTLRAHGYSGGYSNAHIYAGKTVALNITPCLHESGWLQGRSFSANGASQTLIWLWWTGAEPTVELWQNTQAEVLAPINQGMTHFVDGTSVKCAYYRATLAAVGDPSLRLHPPANTRLYGCAAICI